MVMFIVFDMLKQCVESCKGKGKYFHS